MPHLRASGVLRLDGMIVSHADSDHAGGVGSVLRALRVEWIASSLPRQDTRLSLAGGSRPCVSGERWEWDGVGFALLHPQPHGYNSRQASGHTNEENDLSCVLRVSAAGRSMLLTGDIEQRSEQQLLQRASDQLRSDVLVVPHHGSPTSSSVEFLQRVAPEIAIFTVGYRNRFGHPAPAVLDRYQRLGARLYRTDADGALRVRIGSQLVVEAWRRTHPRYWHGR